MRTRPRPHPHPALLAVVVALGVAGGRARGGDAPGFVAEIRPLLERSCTPCHSGERAAGGLRLDLRDAVHQAEVEDRLEAAAAEAGPCSKC